MNRPLIVLKFGSSVLRTAADLPQAIHEIYRYSREGFGVVAVDLRSGVLPTGLSPKRRPWVGTVGRGVYEHLLRNAERFELVAIAVRHRARHEASGVPGHWLLSLDEALQVPTDVVVEAIGGVALAA